MSLFDTLRAKMPQPSLREKLASKAEKEEKEKEENGENGEKEEKKDKKGKKLKPGSLKGGKSEPSSEDEPGEGGRFEALKKKLAKKGAKDPKALAAAIGRAKFGKKKMAQMAKKGSVAGLLKKLVVPGAAAAGGAAAGAGGAYLLGESKRKKQLQQLADLFRKANMQENRMIAHRAFQAGRSSK